MHKKHYLKELIIAATQQRGGANKTSDVLKIQAWLNLYGMVNPTSATVTAIDGDFGPATQRAVQNYQKAEQLPVTGIVTQDVFSHLCKTMQQAFQTPVDTTSMRATVVQVANLHLQNRPIELTIKNQTNSGPWVRAYMDGMEGSQWLWCMGFVQTIIDQAASAHGKSFKTLMPHSYSCDNIGMHAIQKGLLTRYTALRKNPALAQPGDIFLVQKATHDWVHTGIITEVGDSFFETIEGNTNSSGSSNGNGVYKRTRNFMLSKLDVFSIAPLL